MITINGKTISGNYTSISVDGDTIILDGKRQDLNSFKGNDLNITIVVEGNVETLSSVSADVTVNGSSGSVKSTSGDVKVKGDVSGSVSTMSGDVNVKGGVHGNVSTMSGDINR
jgi:hypothetical protein